MSNFDKRDAAQRAVDFFRAKNIKLKRAEALELLAHISGAPNWNVLQAAMRSPAENQRIVEVDTAVSCSPEIPPYVPPWEAFSAGAHAFFHFERVDIDVLKFCREKKAGQQLTGDTHKVEFWDGLLCDLEALTRMQRDLVRWSVVNKREIIPAQVRLDARTWLESIQVAAKPVLEALEEELADKNRNGRPYLPDPHRRLYVELTSVVRFASRAMRKVVERENYDMRIEYLKHIETLMSTTLAAPEGRGAPASLRSACEAAQKAAQAALLLKNNVRKLTGGI